MRAEGASARCARADQEFAGISGVIELGIILHHQSQPLPEGSGVDIEIRDFRRPLVAEYGNPDHDIDGSIGRQPAHEGVDIKHPHELGHLPARCRDICDHFG
jgi:hypothetical protein